MRKQLGAICLIAGTCIGSGMIALPMVLAKLGIVPSVALMLMIWLAMYYSALVNVELNLQAGEGMPLGALGRRFSGKGAEFVGAICLKLLSYALLTVFINGGASIVHSMLHSEAAVEVVSLNAIAACFAIISFLMLLLPIRWIDHINSVLFLGLLGVVALLIAGLIVTMNWNSLPWFAPHYTDFSVWYALVPVVFTSFGFQVIFHTLTNYCKKDAVMLKKAFFWGSLIPAVVYILWTCSVLSAVHSHSPDFYLSMATGNVSVGDLIEKLSAIAQWQSVQLLVWWISLLAITTSILGVGVGLCDALKGMLATVLPSEVLCRPLAAACTILPAYIIAVWIPNAFIAALGFAGMILAVIAILLPLYLFERLQPKSLFYAELKAKWLLVLLVIVGIGVIACEVLNMM